MTEIQNQTGTKKKLLIPVVVLMLLLVSFAGAAYAYSSTLTIDQNKLDANSISIDLTNGTMETNPNTGNYIVASGVVVFEDHFSYTATPAKLDTVKVSVEDKIVLTVHATVGGDAACNTLKVSSSNITTYLNTVVGNDGTNDVKISDLYSIKVGVTNDIAQAVPLTAAATAIPNAIDRAEGTQQATAVTLYVFVDTSLDAPKIVQNAKESTAQGYKVASQFASAFNGYNFGLTFEATYVAPSP